jgi:hypothetical protein
MSLTKEDMDTFGIGSVGWIRANKGCVALMFIIMYHPRPQTLKTKFSFEQLGTTFFGRLRYKFLTRKIVDVLFPIKIGADNVVVLTAKMTDKFK